MAAGDNPFGDEEINDKTATQKARARTLAPLSEDFDWRTKFRTDAASNIKKWSDDFGYSTAVLDTFVRDNIDGAINVMAAYLNVDEVGRPITEVRKLGPTSLASWQRAWDAGMQYFSRVSGLNFDGLEPKGGSGSGSRKPTAGELRAMFDEDELTETVNTMWGAYLVEDAPNARSIAKGYINAIVASGGEQKIDFETFILNKIRKTNRHKLVYRNKPEGTDELQYIQPYTQAAMSVIGGGGRAGASATDVAAGGAALGASASAFGDRLARTPEHQQTTGFINSLEQRVRDVKNVLRG